MPLESIVVVCPDTNVRLWSTRVSEAAMGGGKSSILQLGAAWARLGHPVTLAGGAVREGTAEGVRVVELEHAAGSYDAGIFVTGSLGHFRDPAIAAIRTSTSLFWLNGPNRVEPPLREPDWYVAPAKFLARRAAEDWGFPGERIVVIPGEAVRARAMEPEGTGEMTRDPLGAVYASHPFKGLSESVDVLGRLREAFPEVRLDVYGSQRLWSDAADGTPRGDLPPWVRICGEVPQRDVEDRMARYGLMLYLTEWVDGFSLSTAEALAAGVVVIATAHGSNAELVRHGWNGLLVGSRDGKPDLREAERLARSYFADPSAFRGMRERARGSVPTWDEQAQAWRSVWRSPQPARAR